MNDIKCPHCSKAFKIDESGYADIMQQVRNTEFDREIHERLQLAEKEKQAALELVKEQVRNDMQQATAAKEAEILELKAKVDAGAVNQKLAVSQALKEIEQQRDALATELQQAKRDNTAAAELAKANHNSQLQEASAKKDLQIQQLQAQLAAQQAAEKQAVIEAVHASEKEREELKNALATAKLEKQLSETSLKEKYETQIQDRDDAIERLKDMKPVYRQK